MNCRICKSEKLITVLNLGNQYLSEFRDDDKKPPKFPLDLVICNDCKQVQLRDTVPQNLLYTDNYGYRSGINKTMRDHLKLLVFDVMKRMGDKLKTGDNVVDLGSNDATLLKFYPNYLNRYGYDLVPKFAKDYEGTGITFVNEPFGEVHSQYPMFKIITAISMFYDLDDPISFMQNLAMYLAKDGLICIQQNYLLEMLRINGFDNCCLGKDELVTTIDGLKTIESINEGDFVLTHKGRFRKVLKKFVTKNGHHQLLRLKSYGSGYDIKLTGNHPVIMRPHDGGVWRVRRADTLKIGDIVYKPVITESPRSLSEVMVNANICRIIGYYLSEGSYAKHKDNSNNVGFSFNSNERDTHVSNLVKCLKTEGFSANVYERKETHTIVVHTYGVIAKWLNDNFGHHALRKFIPMWVFSLSDEMLWNILEAYNNGDGYEYRNEKYYRIATVSPNLAYGISLIANRLGYKCSLCEQKKNKEFRAFKHRDIPSKVNNAWDILIHMNPQKEMKVWMEDGKQCSKIKEIEQVSYNDEFVYNLEVEEDHTYVTPAMVVHNCHEHVTYNSVNSMKKICDKVGLEIFDVSVNDLNGGSFRTYICHKGAYKVKKSVKDQLDYELGYGLESMQCYEGFESNVGWAIAELKDFLMMAKAEGKITYICGASTRGNTLLQACGVVPILCPKAIERNPEKYGKKIASCGIPIVSEEEGLADNPDYLLVLPFFFRREMESRYAKYIKNGGKLIFPLPKLEVVSK